MNKEIYWKKALKQTEISIKENSLCPLRTIDITSQLYNSSDFITMYGLSGTGSVGTPA